MVSGAAAQELAAAAGLAAVAAAVGWWLAAGAHHQQGRWPLAEGQLGPPAAAGLAVRGVEGLPPLPEEQPVHSSSDCVQVART